MQEYKIDIVLPDGNIEKINVEENTKIEELAKKYNPFFKNPIILSIYNGKLRELCKKIDRDGKIEFLTIADRDGRRTYRRSVILLLQRAVQKLYGDEVELKVLHSLGEGYYCEIINLNKSVLKLHEDDISSIKKTMDQLVQQNIPITKNSEKTQTAEEMFAGLGMKDKERLLHYRRSSRVNIYELDGIKDYFYGYMAPSTGVLRYYDVVSYEDGFVIVFPSKGSNKVEPLNTSNKLFHTLDESRDWSRMLGIGTVGALNDAISAGKGQQIMLLQEALMEERIGRLAAIIAGDDKKKFVMIAGPSSSGKTSFANRLSIQLTAKGLKPHPVSLDDYYADREFCPRNPDGSFDFECLEALDVDQFNKDMMDLLNGMEVKMPSFNFKTGKREYRGDTLKLGDGDILVIEGIHGLNDKLSYMLPSECKFKIYISALTQLNIDEHNPLPTTDSRLIRRIVRDARTRGTNAKETIAMWPSVRNGEEKNIFPYQDSADVMFNSALIYELPVLKVYAEPLLFGIGKDCPEYLEAKRLLKFLDYFLPLPAEGIPNNSLVREFVGGSCFNV